MIEFKDNNCFSGVKDIFIRHDKKLLKIFYGATGDLYFDIFGSHNIDENGCRNAIFTIKQHEEIYQYFEQLVNCIIGCEVFDIGDIENETLKSKRVYKELVQNDMIVWYSDNIYDESANILQIERGCEGIKLTFIDNPKDPSFGFGIRICNSGSKYDPFNICFMNLFNQLQLLGKNDSLKKMVKIEKSCK